MDYLKRVISLFLRQFIYLSKLMDDHIKPSFALNQQKYIQKSKVTDLTSCLFIYFAKLSNSRS
mgnify:CR=1 FL=1